MHVCIATYDCDTNTGGVTSWVIRILRELKLRGWKTSCVLYSTSDKKKQGTLEQFLVKHDIPYRRTQFYQYMEEKVQWTCDSVKALQADVLLTNSMIPAWYAAPQLEASGIPCIGVNHSDDPFYHALTDHCIAKDGWYQLSGLVAVSKYLEERTGDVASDRTTIARIPCGIDATDPSVLTQAADKRADDKFRIVYVGRFVEEQKQVTRVAKCVCRAAQRYANVEGYFIGTGPSDVSIQAVIDTTKTSSQVQVVGWLHADEVTQRVAEMDAIVLLSDYEGLPVVLLEAMSVGTVPICSRMKSGVDELIRHGENGLFVDPTEVAFTEAIGTLLESPETQHRLAANAQHTIRGEYLNANCTQRWMDFIETVLQRFERPAFDTMHADLPTTHPDLAPCDQRRPPLHARIRAKLEKRAKKLRRSVLKRIRRAA